MQKFIWTQQELQQGSIEWLTIRKTTLGGSEVACLMGASPFKNFQQLWEGKTGRFVEIPQNTDAMERGNRLEPVAREDYSKRFNRNVEQLCMRHPHPDFQFMWTSLDGITVERDLILEIKAPTTAELHRKHTKGGLVPTFRYPQLQHQLAVTAAHFPQAWAVHYYSFWLDEEKPGSEPKPVCIEVEPDWSYIRELMKREYIFMECVRKDVPPNPKDFAPYYGQGIKPNFSLAMSGKGDACMPPIPTGGRIIYGNPDDSKKRRSKAAAPANL